MTETIETIRYTADVVATTPDGRVLLIERGWPPYQGQLALPDAPEGAAIRVFKAAADLPPYAWLRGGLR